MVDEQSRRHILALYDEAHGLLEEIHRGAKGPVARLLVNAMVETETASKRAADALGIQTQAQAVILGEETVERLIAVYEERACALARP